MNGTLLSVCFPGASASFVVRAATLAEDSNLDGFFIGDPRGTAANSNDNYVMTALAGAAAVTDYIRLGAFLPLDRTTNPIRTAEDIGVADSTAAGRVEVALLAGSEAGWEARATKMLEAPHYLPLGDGRSMSINPKSKQPWLPRVVFGDPAAAGRLGAGIGLFPGDAADVSSIVGQRRMLLVETFSAGGSVREVMADAGEVVRQIRAQVDAVKAHQVVVTLPADTITLDEDLRLLGGVLSTGLRCADFDADKLTWQAWRWITELAPKIAHRAAVPATQ